MTIPSHQLFTRCGQFLCGPDLKWKEQLAAMLMVQTNTVDNWAKGMSRVPPGVWREIAAFIQDREAQAPVLRLAALQAAEQVARPTLHVSGFPRPMWHERDLFRDQFMAWAQSQGISPTPYVDDDRVSFEVDSGNFASVERQLKGQIDHLVGPNPAPGSGFQTQVTSQPRRYALTLRRS
jgi:hypothetical protein